MGRIRCPARALIEEDLKLETETIIHTALFSGILGFLAFCASYAMHVWRSRNAASRQSRPAAGARLFRWSILSICLGCVLLLVSFIWREVKPREGLLSGEGIFTARADNNLQLEYVTSARAVKMGDVLARFRSPERRAELIELELKRQILETQRKVTELQPLAPDNELVRHFERAVADQRQLLASLTYLIPEHAVVIREKLRDRLDKTERINALTTRIDSARRETEQAIARRALAAKHLARVANLSKTGAAAELETDERHSDSVVQDTEVTRLQMSVSNMEVERNHLHSSLPEFAACTSQQAEELDHELSRVREQLTATEREVDGSNKRLDQDRKRAELLRAQMLIQLDLEIRQCQAKLEGVQDVLTIKAPFDGVIAYSDPAPGTALPMAPVVILTPEQGFRFRLRMTEAEIVPLSKTESVTLGLIAPVLQRRFPGRLIKWDRLPHEPGYVVAELACLPPSETIRELAAHDWGAHDRIQMPTFKVRLLWHPPIFVSPVFYPAVGMVAVGLIGFCTMLLQGSRKLPRSSGDAKASTEGRTTTHPAVISTELISPPAPTSLACNALDLEAGALGRNLQMLGQRFRESIKRQSVEPTLISSLEWAIDRHHARALEHLATGLDHDPDLTPSLQRLISSSRTARRSDGAGQEQAVAVDRILRIIEAIAPHLLNAPETHRAAAVATGRTSTSQGTKSRELGAASC
jgi:hypothetical protein